MDKKSRIEQIFIMIMICGLCFIGLCIMGCGGSCLGCDWGCEQESGEYCISGTSCMSSDCISDDSCAHVCGFVDTEVEDMETDDVYIVSCETQSDGCDGRSGCYNGVFCGSCGGFGDCGGFGNCGLFCGEIDGWSALDTTCGVVGGCPTCEKSSGDWHYILEAIFDWLGLKGGI